MHFLFKLFIRGQHIQYFISNALSMLSYCNRQCQCSDLYDHFYTYSASHLGLWGWAVDYSRGGPPTTTTDTADDNADD